MTWNHIYAPTISQIISWSFKFLSSTFLRISQLKKENSNTISKKVFAQQAINICTGMFYDLECFSGFIWCGILHIKERYQRNMVPFFPRIWLFIMEANLFWSRFNFLYSSSYNNLTKQIIYSFNILPKTTSFPLKSNYKNLNATLHCLWSHWSFLLRNSRCDLHLSHCHYFG